MNAVDIFLFKKMYGGGYPQLVTSEDASGNVEYMGFGERGAATSDSSWLIIKFTYHASGNIATAKSSKDHQVWDNRATTVTYG